MVAKICHLTTVHPRYDTRIFAKMCKSLSQDFDLTLLVADGQGNETRDSIDIFDVGDFTGSRVRRMLLGGYCILKKSLRLRADLYHFHDPELIIAGLVLKAFGKNVIYDVHEDVPRQIMRKHWIPAIYKTPLSFIISRVESLCALFFDAVITVTPTIAQRFAGKQVIEVRNYPSLREFAIGDSEASRSAVRSHAIYVGAISKERGILQMIEAFKETSHTLVLGGKFANNNIEKQSRNSKGWENVEFIGWLQRDEVTNILTKSLVGLVVLQPTGDYEDALPVKLFEYMAAGVAVVSSDFSIWKDIVDIEMCGICVDPTSPHLIRESLDYLLCNPSIAVEMGRRGRAAILEKYNWESEYKKLVACYHNMLRLCPPDA
jgi:glycosyltransferase involved in cell wall biosynthesis